MAWIGEVGFWEVRFKDVPNGAELLLCPFFELLDEGFECKYDAFQEIIWNWREGLNGEESLCGERTVFYTHKVAELEQIGEERIDEK